MARQYRGRAAWPSAGDPPQLVEEVRDEYHVVLPDLWRLFRGLQHREALAVRVEIEPGHAHSASRKTSRRLGLLGTERVSLRHIGRDHQRPVRSVLVEQLLAASRP